MNKSIKRGVAIALLLFTFTVPATTFAMTNEGQIENQSESIYEPQKEEFEKMFQEYQEIQVKQISLQIIHQRKPHL